jgi:hypothetical protein
MGIPFEATGLLPRRRQSKGGRVAWLVGIPKCEACVAGQHRLGLFSHFGAMRWPSDARSMPGPADQGGHLGPCLFSLGPEPPRGFSRDKARRPTHWWENSTMAVELVAINSSVSGGLPFWHAPHVTIDDKPPLCVSGSRQQIAQASELGCWAGRKPDAPD